MNGKTIACVALAWSCLPIMAKAGRPTLSQAESESAAAGLGVNLSPRRLPEGRP